MNNNNNKRNKKNKKQNKSVMLAKDTSRNKDMSLNLVVPSPFPTSMRCTLTCDTGPIPIQAAAQWASKAIQINNPYDGITGPAAPICAWYAQLVAIYGRLLTKIFRLSFEVVSNEPATPVYFGVGFSDVQPSTSVTSRALAIDFLEKTPSTGIHSVGQTTGASHYTSPVYTIKPECLTLRSNYNGSIDYACTAGSPPAQVLWAEFEAFLGNGANVANGVIVSFHLEYDVEASSLVN